MKQSFDYIQNALWEIYSLREISSLSVLILQHITNFSQAKILTNKDLVLSDNEHEKIHLIVERLKKNEPLEYILGKSEFFDLIFEVNEHTLIPRPETEELVNWIVEDYKAESQKTILDIGTGSGCIAVSLAKNLPKNKVAALDISEEALKTARKNAGNNNVEVEFLQKDILQPSVVNHQSSFDIIVSNPPYVCESEKAEMTANVLNYEPHTALFVPNDEPLIFYKAIAVFAKLNLTPGGSLYFEINRAFGKEICLMLEDLGFVNIELRKDLFGNDRMIKATLQPPKGGFSQTPESSI
jgi:release factor glutamine methyltransferase